MTLEINEIYVNGEFVSALDMLDRYPHSFHNIYKVSAGQSDSQINKLQEMFPLGEFWSTDWDDGTVIIAGRKIKQPPTSKEHTP